MAPAGFEPAIRASELPQTDAVNCAATVIGLSNHTFIKYLLNENPKQNCMENSYSNRNFKQMTDF
jgi:hypothetical protein